MNLYYLRLKIADYNFSTILIVCEKFIFKLVREEKVRRFRKNLSKKIQYKNIN